MKDMLVFLGTGAAASTQRQLTSLAFVTKEKNFLMDCGDGMGTVRNVIRAGIELSSIRDIFLTHRHADHILGISHILFLLLIKDPKAKIRVFGPSEAVKTAKTIAFLTHDYTRIHHHRVGFVPLKSKQSVLLGKQVTVQAVRVNGPTSHEIVTYGYKVTVGNKNVVFTGDMQPSAQFTTFSENADILIHEVYTSENTDDDGVHSAGHSTARDAGECGRNAHVQTLVLTHFRNRNDVSVESCKREAARYFPGEILVAEDLMEISL